MYAPKNLRQLLQYQSMYGAVSGPCRGRVGAVSGPCRGRIGAIYNIFPDFGSLGFWILGGLCMRSFYLGCTIWKLEFACDTRF